MKRAREINLQLKESEYKCTSFTECNKAIQELAQKNNGEKIGFTIVYEDGYKYIGKSTLNKTFKHFDNYLQHHIFGNAKWNAGLATNPACGMAAYKRMLEQEPMASRINDYAHFLNNYQIGDEPYEFRAKLDSKSAIKEINALITYNNICIVKEQEKIKGNQLRITKLETFNQGMNAILLLSKNEYKNSLEALRDIKHIYKDAEKPNSPFNKGVIYATKKLFNIDLSKTKEIDI